MASFMEAKAASLDDLLEAEKRGILPPSMVETLREARQRGLIGQRSTGNPTQQYTPVPKAFMPREAVPPPYEPPISRGTMSGVGGAAGGLLGTAGGPAGVLAGGAGGAAAGSSMYDAMNALSRTVFGERGQPRTGGFLGPSKKAAEAALTDAVWSAGAMSAGPIIKATVKPALGKAFGIFSEDFKKMYDMARDFGVNLGTQHLSPRKAVKGTPQVLGVFPFVGTPFRKGQARVVGEIDKAAADILNTLAPTSSLSRLDVGKSLTEAGARRFAANSRIANALYKEFYKLADTLPENAKAIVPSGPIKDALGAVDVKTAREAIPLSSGGLLKGPGADEVGDFIRQFEELPDMLTVEQARGLERTLNAFIKKGTTEGWDLSRIGNLKKGLEKAKDSLDLSNVDEAVAAEIRGAWDKANAFWGQMMDVFSTPTAQRFGSVDKNIFNQAVWKPGSKNADEIYKAVFNTKSVEALSDLRKLVGDKEFHRAARVHLQDAFDASRIKAKEGMLVDELFSAQKFKEKLGLNTKAGKDVMEEMLRGSDVTMKDLENFLKVAEAGTDIVIRDPSTFLTRRIILGGGAAAMGGFAVGAGKVSLPAAAVITYVLNRGAHFLMNPKQLERMTRIMSDSTTDKARRMLAAKLILSLEPDETPEVMN